MQTDADRVPLAARAWIADGVRGALVAADGTIDWYCPAGFDGPPALWRLVDPGGAAVRVGPVREGTGVGRRLPPGGQRYVGDSLVAETVLRTGSGQAVQVLDALPWAGASETPPGRIVRLATALAGPVDVEVEVLPGTGAGRVDAGSEGVAWGSLLVRAGVAFEPSPLGRDRPRWRAVCRLEPGASLVVTIDDRGSDAGALSADAARRILDATVVAWESWLRPLATDGPHGHRGAVARSALLVRSLTGPAGAPVAAGTTSLPRRAGGERTSDDRGVWLRDAAGAAATMAGAGLDEDAEAAERWLRGAIEGWALPWPASLTP
ncbi:MAG: glycoside hydrolase family 15 protein, partial [Acidimicrobiales bacterium]